MTRLLKFFLLFAAGSSLFLFLYIYFTRSSFPFYSPLGPTPQIKASRPVSSSPIVYGFLPYWNLNQLDPSTLKELTHFAYFALTPSSTGKLLSHTSPTQLEPGWHTLHKSELQSLLAELKSSQVKTHLTITLFDDAELDTFLTNPTAHTTFISEVIPLLTTHHFDGLNIDFEPHGSLPELAPAFTKFIQTLDSQLAATNPDLELFLDIFPGAAQNPNLWDLPSLVPHVDQFIVMTYDYHNRQSTKAGPIAPLYSSTNSNILNHLKSLSAEIPTSQLILGLPTYGFRWQTIDLSLGSHTFPGSGSLITQKDLSDFITRTLTQIHYDDSTGTSWYSGLDEDIHYQLHIDTPHSLNLKKQLVSQSQMSGFAIWALGYYSEPLGLSL